MPRFVGLPPFGWPVPRTVFVRVSDQGGGDRRTGTAVHAGSAPAPGTERLSVAVHRPLPTVLVVRPSGVLDEETVPAVDAHIGDPSGDVLHVVIDLRGLEPLTPSGVRALLELDRRATHRGTALHLAGGANHALLQRLFRAQVLRGAPWCDELLGG
jgi:ABC-type transporter Mla MlaB component